MYPQNIKCSLGGLWGKKHVLIILGGKKKYQDALLRNLFSPPHLSPLIQKKRLWLNGTNAKIKLLPHPPPVM